MPAGCVRVAAAMRSTTAPSATCSAPLPWSVHKWTHWMNFGTGIFGGAWPAVWTADLKIVDHRRPAHARRGLPHLGRAQGDRLHAGPDRSQTGSVPGA